MAQTSDADRLEIIAKLLDSGWTAARIAAALGETTSRATVYRRVQELREVKNASDN
jgi:transposase-like protein